MWGLGKAALHALFNRLPACLPACLPLPCSCSTLDEVHTRAALRWLAAFHAACWGADAAALGLWEQGSYWCLQTRWGGGLCLPRWPTTAAHLHLFAPGHLGPDGCA